jgi:hypothetical protein
MTFAEQPSCPIFLIEHDPEKWAPVFRKDRAQTKRREHDAIQSDRIMFVVLPTVQPCGT